MKNRPKIGLALSSGAARGLAHIGIFKVFEEENIPVDYIAGSSIGALIGALYSVGLPSKVLEGLAFSLGRKHMFDWQLSRLGVISGKKIEDILNLLTKGQNFADIKIPLAIVATDINEGSLVVIKEGPLTSAVRASISVPGIFPPVKHEGRMLVDGGVLCRLPVNEVKEMGADVVIAVDVGLHIKKTTINNLFDVISQTIDIMGKEIMANNIVKADLLILPDVGSVSLTHFQKSEECIQAGEEAARKVLPEVESLLKERGYIV